MNKIFDAAIEYAQLGYRVFPCKPGEKAPIVATGFKAATDDLAQIRLWSCQHERANVAIRTGNGLLVIDVDPRNGGTESLAKVEAELGPLPRDYVVKTPSGGLHIYVQYNGPKLRTKRPDWPGIDFKGEGGYVVAPPSVLANGGSYVCA